MNIREPRDFQPVRHKRKRSHSFKQAKRFAVLFVVSVLAMSTVAFASYMRPMPELKPQTIRPRYQTQGVGMPWPAKGTAAIGVAGGSVLASTTNQTPSPTASVAKVMTALMVLKKHPLKPGEQGPNFTITDDDVALYRQYVSMDGSVLPVHTGQVLTEYQALQAIMLPSANNIADLLAVWSYGSIGDYLKEANATAKSLGMTNTRFADDASGYSPKTTSTSHDLVLLGQAALANPVLKEIVSQKSAEIPGSGTIQNVNALLSHGMTGIKTGNTDEAGGCYLFSSDHTLANGKTITIVGAVMGAQHLGIAMRDAQNMLKTAREHFAPRTVIRKGQAVANYELPWGGTVQAVAQHDVTLYGWKAAVPQIQFNTQQVRTPAKAGDSVGSVVLTAGGEQATANLVLSTPIAAPPWSWRILH